MLLAPLLPESGSVEGLGCELALCYRLPLPPLPAADRSPQARPPGEQA